MLTLTESASAFLADVLAHEESPDDVAVRLVYDEEEGLAMTLDSARPGDAAFDHKGRTVLVLDETVAQWLSDDTLDIKDSDDGPELALLRAGEEDDEDDEEG